MFGVSLFTVPLFVVSLIVGLVACPLSVVVVNRRQAGIVDVGAHNLRRRAWQLRQHLRQITSHDLLWCLIIVALICSVACGHHPEGAAALSFAAVPKKSLAPPLIEHVGEAITLPALPHKMPIAKAIEWLTVIQKEQEQVIAVQETIDAYPWDAARAFMIAVKRRFGFAEAKGSKWNPPQMINVMVDVDQSESIAWGDFVLPGIEGSFSMMTSRNQHDQMTLCLVGNVQRKDSHVLQELAAATRDILKTDSIYRGKVLRYLWDYDKETAKIPEFVDVSKVNPEHLIFSEDVKEQVNTTVFAPLRRFDWCRLLHVPFKRGICLLGKYGVGKTLAIYVAAFYAKAAGITTVLVDDAEKLPEAMLFARQYAPALVVCEDIDRVTNERDDVCNNIMDALDGVEAKDTDVMVLFTSNDADSIHEAMRRPGRIDTFIKITPPDATAVEQLIRHYAGAQVTDEEDLTDVCSMLSGQIPAVIREVVERAKLAAIARADDVADARFLWEMDLIVSAKRMLMQLQLFTPPSGDAERALKSLAKFGAELVQSVQAAANSRSIAKLFADAHQNGSSVTAPIVSDALIDASLLRKNH